jgi:hypothetical protein
VSASAAASDRALDEAIAQKRLELAALADQTASAAEALASLRSEAVALASGLAAARASFDQASRAADAGLRALLGTSSGCGTGSGGSGTGSGGSACPPAEATVVTAAAVTVAAAAGKVATADQGGKENSSSVVSCLSTSSGFSASGTLSPSRGGGLASKHRVVSPIAGWRPVVTFSPPLACDSPSSRHTFSGSPSGRLQATCAPLSPKSPTPPR